MSGRARQPDKRAKCVQEIYDVVVDGTALPAVVRRDTRARRFILRLARDGAGLRVTAPAGAHAREITGFVARHHDWIARRLRGRPAAVAFVAGATVPLRGVDHRLVARPVRRAATEVRREGGDPVIAVGGDPAHFARRTRDWLRAEARRDLDQAVTRYARLLGVRPRRLTLRDQTSRWGSCSSSGTLSFSWRLVLAPPEVLDYVAAHEVAHLLEMNHSPRFWAHVRRVCAHTDSAREWLAKHGNDLHRFGIET